VSRHSRGQTRIGPLTVRGWAAGFGGYIAGWFAARALVGGMVLLAAMLIALTVLFFAAFDAATEDEKDDR
jgi:hypothetical protein